MFFNILLLMFTWSIPRKTVVFIGENWIKLVGPGGEVIKKKPKDLILYFDQNKDCLYCLNINSKKKKKIFFFFKVLDNLIESVSYNFFCKLKIVGVGYKWSIHNNLLILKLGFSHDVKYIIPKDIKLIIPVEKSPFIVIKGYNYQRVNQIAAEIRRLKKPDIYKGKGIRYINEIVKLKEGKRNNV